MQTKVSPWLFHQVIIAQRKTKRAEREDWLFIDDDGRRPLQYAIGLSDNGRHVRVEIACKVDFSGASMAEARRMAEEFATALSPKSRWQIIYIASRPTLRIDLPIEEFFEFLPGLLISRVLEEPARRWREFLDALELPKS